MSVATAFKSMNHATNFVSAGDTLLIKGIYKNESFNDSYSYINEHDPHLWHAENSIRINNLNGSSSAYTTIKAFDENTLLKGDGGNIFRVTNSSYLRIKGFKIEEEVDPIPINTANALQFIYIDEIILQTQKTQLKQK